MGVRHGDHQHPVVVVAAFGAPEHAHGGGEGLALGLEPRDGWAQERVEVDVVEAKLLAGEEGVDLAAVLGHLAQARERELDRLAGVLAHHAQAVVDDVRLDVLEDAALGVGVAQRHLVEGDVDALLVAALGDSRLERDSEERLVVRPHRRAREGDGRAVRELGDLARPRAVVGEVVDLVEDEHHATAVSLGDVAVALERRVAAAPARVLVGGDEQVGARVLGERAGRVGDAERDRRGAEVGEEAGERLAVGVLVAEVAARHEHDDAPRHAARAGDEEGSEGGDRLAVAGHEDAEVVPVAAPQGVGELAEERHLPAAKRKPTDRRDAGKRDAGRLSVGGSLGHRTLGYGAWVGGWGWRAPRRPPLPLRPSRGLRSGPPLRAWGEVADRPEGESPPAPQYRRRESNPHVLANSRF